MNNVLKLISKPFFIIICVVNNVGRVRDGGQKIKLNFIQMRVCKHSTLFSCKASFNTFIQISKLTSPWQEQCSVKEITEGEECGKAWARLLVKIYEVDPILCSKCPAAGEKVIMRVGS